MHIDDEGQTQEPLYADKRRKNSFHKLCVTGINCRKLWYIRPRTICAHSLHVDSPAVDLLREDTNLQGYETVSVLLLDVMLLNRVTEIAVTMTVRGE